jgi:signal transduction histidine kinase
MHTNKHIYEEVKKAAQNEKQIQENTKMVQMGEMIGNIAHQWRQPLSAIGSSVSAMKLENSLGMLSSEDIDTYCDNVSIKAQYLSQTQNSRYWTGTSYE